MSSLERSPNRISQLWDNARTLNLKSCLLYLSPLLLLYHIFLSKWAQFWDEGQFTDVRFIVPEDIFPAHSIVFAANNDYFHSMFTAGMKESNQAVIELNDKSISTDVLKIVMDSIYTGDLNVNEENVFEVLAAADNLQVTTVVQQCWDVMIREFNQLRFDLHNYFLLSTVANRHVLRDLQQAAEHNLRWLRFTCFQPPQSRYRSLCEIKKTKYIPYISILSRL